MIISAAAHGGIEHQRACARRCSGDADGMDCPVRDDLGTRIDTFGNMGRNMRMRDIDTMMPHQ
jgi:hypothetical protein